MRSPISLRDWGLNSSPVTAERSSAYSSSVAPKKENLQVAVPPAITDIGEERLYLLRPVEPAPSFPPGGQGGGGRDGIHPELVAQVVRTDNDAQVVDSVQCTEVGDGFIFGKRHPVPVAFFALDGAFEAAVALRPVCLADGGARIVPRAFENRLPDGFGRGHPTPAHQVDEGRRPVPADPKLSENDRRGPEQSQDVLPCAVEAGAGGGGGGPGHRPA